MSNTSSTDIQRVAKQYIAGLSHMSTATKIAISTEMIVQIVLQDLPDRGDAILDALLNVLAATRSELGK